jgi:uncharacterized protein YijF (DUF1287 family)
MPASQLRGLSVKIVPMRYQLLIFLICLIFTNASCNKTQEAQIVPRKKEPKGFSLNLSKAALERTKHKVKYDPTYIEIDYPNGDVPPEIGVCTDVVIRSYRAIGIDLQKDIHEEMMHHFDEFPDRKRWGLTKPDSNIDHRRVPNLQVLFQRNGENLAVTSDSKDYIPGDLVTWSVQGRPHIGIVVNRKKGNSERFMIVHNIGQGPVLEDMLFKYPITGHYRYYGSYGRRKI